MEDSFFEQKETGPERVAMATALRASFCFFCDGQIVVPSFKNTALIFLEILFFSILQSLVTNNMTSSLI